MLTIKKYSYLLALLCLFSCDGTKEEEDLTLTIEEYVQLGVPSLEAEWTLKDFAICAKTLQSLKEVNYKQLPQYASAKSGELFKRIFTDGHFSQLYAQNIPSQNRKQLKLGNQAMKTFGDLYRIDGKFVPEYHTEWAHIYVYMLKWQQELFVGLLKLEEAGLLTASDENQAAILKDQYSKIIAEQLKKLREAGSYFDTVDIQLICAEIINSVKKYKDYIGAEAQEQLVSELNALIKETEEQSVKVIYAEMMSLIE